MNQPDSSFASTERSSSLDIYLDAKLLESEKAVLDMLGAISGVTAILDDRRQIVYANNQFLELLGIGSLSLILGKRPGEAVGCIHAGERAYGCGTSESCSVCGAVNAIVESQSTGKKSARETRITSEKDDKLTSWDLMVTSSPVSLKDKTYYVFTVQDISDQKKRQSLERIFFHDILNTAGNLNAILAILKEGAEPDEYPKLIDISERASKDLIEEILQHRQLRSAETGDLAVKIERLRPIEMVESAVEKMALHETAKGKRMLIADHSNNSELMTDRIILQRILINLLKNALEATMVGGTVFAEAEDLKEAVRFRVRNDFVMPEEVRKQIFQRSFTTKESGRGTGTYSIKLLTENYLKGKAGFSSSAGEGTVFYIDLPKELS